jgi:hypothetical protein
VCIVTGTGVLAEEAAEGKYVCSACGFSAPARELQRLREQAALALSSAQGMLAKGKTKM